MSDQVNLRNGAVHPTTIDQWENGLEGILLRDYFAIRILCAAINSPGRMAEIYNEANELALLGRQLDVEFAYKMADMMLAERKRGV